MINILKVKIQKMQKLRQESRSFRRTIKSNIIEVSIENLKGLSRRDILPLNL